MVGNSYKIVTNCFPNVPSEILLVALAPEVGDIWLVATGSLITKELNDYSQEVVTLCPRERQGKKEGCLTTQKN